MATSRPKSSTLGKERRGTSPSPNTTKKTTITKHSTASAPKPTSPPSDKSSSVPHYLKPTISSRLDSSSNSFKKPAHGSHDQDAANKALLLRRRSFDRPPPSSPSTTTTSRVHKALVSPGPRERMAASRSSSFSHKNVAAPKPSNERSLKTPTWGKSRSLNAKSSVRKTPSPAIKKESKAAAAAAFSSSSNVVELKKEEEEVLIPEIGEIIETTGIGEIIKTAEREVENLSKVLPNSEDFVGNEVKINGDQDDEHKYCSDISTVSEEQNVPEGSQNEEIEVQVEEKGINVEHEKEEENQGKNKSNPEDQIESTVETVAEDNIEEENEKENPEIEKSIENSGDTENKLEEKEKVHDEENENEKAAVEDVKEVKAAEGENAVAGKKEGGGQATPSSAKKESPAYNDVIEETASKLLEKRKNKVKALVGAFETVISLQEPEP